MTSFFHFCGIVYLHLHEILSPIWFENKCSVLKFYNDIVTLFQRTSIFSYDLLKVFLIITYLSFFLIYCSLVFQLSF